MKRIKKIIKLKLKKYLLGILDTPIYDDLFVLPLTPKSLIRVGPVNLWIIKDASLKIGENVVLRSEPYDYHVAMPFRTTLLADKPGAIILIGDNTRINGAYIHAWKRITIGSNCLIAAGVNIFDANGHQMVSCERTKTTDTPEDIYIGDNVWICMNAIILKGTRIGDNSIVTANSVVKGVFPKGSIITGNPAVCNRIINVC